MNMPALMTPKSTMSASTMASINPKAQRSHPAPNGDTQSKGFSFAFNLGLAFGFRITLPFTFRLGNVVGLLAFHTRPFERDSEHSPYMRSER